MWYFVRTPAILRWVFRSCIWSKNQAESSVYLSFDDGPHPAVTPFVLDELKKWKAKATFFCIGENVRQYPELFSRIAEEGHSIGNHTFHHLNGWQTKDELYIQDIHKAREVIPSTLFRPPYGKIRFVQLKQIRKQIGLNVVMWSLLSGDFDQHISPEKCAQNVIDNIRNGDIVVFHDSVKAMENLQYALPVVMKYLTDKGFVCKVL